jgi:hypothetical protein
MLTRRDLAALRLSCGIYEQGRRPTPKPNPPMAMPTREPLKLLATAVNSQSAHR